jgi:hypothetical protein
MLLMLERERETTVKYVLWQIRALADCSSTKHWGESELVMYAEQPVTGTWTKSDVTNVLSKKKGTLHRIPDAIVFSQGQNSQMKAFTPAAQSKQCCLTTEAKRVLDAAHLREAPVECERNFGRQTDPTPRKVKSGSREEFSSSCFTGE